MTTQPPGGPPNRPTRPPSRPTPPPAPPRISPLPFAGMIGLACVLFLDLGTLSIIAWWGVVLLVAIWVLLLVIGLAWWTPHPRRLPWLAGFGLVVWVAVVAGVSLATRG